ncbi:hypothetical protein L6452_04130 [Arctium lappa]|uniref:Uncharacterized protein n=1 Tax=Arctium lappa TaxID=4217 RepID=A0ACB9FNT2_ARCLA|nr:hypothetical protein L6452_04130 [Arctium lappa]
MVISAYPQSVHTFVSRVHHRLYAFGLSIKRHWVAQGHLVHECLVFLSSRISRTLACWGDDDLFSSSRVKCSRFQSGSSNAGSSTSCVSSWFNCSALPTNLGDLLILCCNDAATIEGQPLNFVGPRRDSFEQSMSECRSTRQVLFNCDFNTPQLEDYKISTTTPIFDRLALPSYDIESVLKGASFLNLTNDQILCFAPHLDSAFILSFIVFHDLLCLLSDANSVGLTSVIGMIRLSSLGSSIKCHEYTTTCMLLPCPLRGIRWLDVPEFMGV